MTLRFKPIRFFTHLLICSALGITVIASIASAEDNSWSDLMDSGKAAFKQHDYAQAEQSFKAAASAAQSIQANDTRLASTLNDLALVYDAQGKTEDAEKLFKQAIDILEKV